MNSMTTDPRVGAMAPLTHLETDIRALGFGKAVLRQRSPDGRWSSSSRLGGGFLHLHFTQCGAAPTPVMTAMAHASPFPVWWADILGEGGQSDLALVAAMREEGIEDILGLVFLNASGVRFAAHYACSDRGQVDPEAQATVSSHTLGAFHLLTTPESSSVNASPSPCLSPRELDVLSLLVAGKSNPEIAAALETSINTVEFHLKNIFPKLGVYNRVGAAVVAVKTGLIP